MESIEIFDSVNNKQINVFVSSEVAEKCRTDNSFAEDLFNNLQEQDVVEGSVLEIETVKTEVEAEDGSLIEEKSDKETWSRRETLKLLKVYQMYKDKFSDFKRKKGVWSLIANELIHLDVYKTPEKCAEKWKNLIRTYKHTNEKPCTPTRFQFYQEMKDIFNNTQVTISDTDSDDEVEVKHRPPPTSDTLLDLEYKPEPIEKENWSKYETLKLLKAFQKHKTAENNFTKERQFWAVVSAELAKDDIHKPFDKCATKWKNLYRSYKKNIDKATVPTRFQYFQEVCDVINGVELTTPEDDMNAIDGMDFEKIVVYEQNIATWTADETLKLIKAYKKHKHRFMKCPTKKYVWAIIASELAYEGIQRDTEKCENKWKSLTRSYRKCVMSGDKTRFQFYNEMFSALNDNDLNDGEVSTTQKDMLVEYDNMESLDNDDSAINKTEIVESEDNDDMENITYEEIIIETEPDKSEDLDKYWSYNETTALLKAYAAHSKKFKEVKRKAQIWEDISQELESLNVHKAPETCEKKWRSMFSVYKAHKLNKTGPGKFAFYKEIDDILKDKIDIEDMEENVALKKNCKCTEKRLIEKQKRHIERMQLLKRKLDLEERKVEAFEDYVKHLKMDRS